MKRTWMGLLGTVAVVFGGACASNGFESVAIARDASVVASCQKVDEVKVGDVKADEKLSDMEAERMLVQQARSKGANYVLIASEAAREGEAYRCNMPADGTRPGSSQ